jgi:hypothetical protein
MWWFTPIITATWEVEIRRMEVQGQPRQKVSETPSQSKSGIVGQNCDALCIGVYR